MLGHQNGFAINIFGERPPAVSLSRNTLCKLLTLM